MLLIGASCRDAGEMAPPIMEGLIIHRGIPLVDASGHNWKTVEDYVNGGADNVASLIELRFSTESSIHQIQDSR